MRPLKRFAVEYIDNASRVRLRAVYQCWAFSEGHALRACVDELGLAVDPLAVIPLHE